MNIKNIKKGLLIMGLIDINGNFNNWKIWFGIWNMRFEIWGLMFKLINEIIDLKICILVIGIFYNKL